MKSQVRILSPRFSAPIVVRGAILILAGAASWLLYLHRYTWGVLTASGRGDADRLAGSLSATELGWLDSGFSLSYGAGQIPGGWLADRFGPRLILSTSAACWSLALAAFAFGGGFWPLLGLRAIFGLAQAAALPCLSKVTRSWFSAPVRTTVQGLVASMSARAGGACASLIVATLLIGTIGMDWRGALLVLAFGGILYALAFAGIFRNTPAEHPWLRESNADDGVALASSTRPLTISWDRGNRINMAFFLTHAFASAFADNLFVYWIPRFLTEAHRLDVKEMGVYTSLPLWGGALGGVCGGILNDALIRATGRRRLSRSAVAIVGKGLAAFLVVAGAVVLDPFAAMMGLALCKFFSDWSQGSLWGTVTDIAGPAAGRVFGIVNTAGIVGAFAAGPIMGYVKQHHGWDALFFTVAGVYAIGSLCWLAIDCTRTLVVAGGADGPANDAEG